ncbi:MAG: hypothetical protein JO326_08490, partial [Acetobacteraceae bacterium]|nr:hypothetical protein [Acetobacteraceae bacterium]
MRIAALALVLAFAGFGHLARAQSSVDVESLPPWRVPDVGVLPDDEQGRLVRYGRSLIEHTSALIGPDAKDPAMRFAGNGLVCQNCHLDAGTARFALPFVG